MIVTSKDRVREYRARAEELRVKAEGIFNVKEWKEAVCEAEMLEQMADREERATQAPT